MLIAMVLQCIAEIQPFLVVLGVMMMSFALPFHFRAYHLDQDDFEWKNVIYDTFYLCFGDFSPIQELDTIFAHLLYSFGVFLLVLIMMNLLIGIISVKLEEVISESTINDY